MTRRVRNLTVGGIAAALLLTAWAPGALAAPRPLSVNLSIGDSCVTGLARKNSFVKVVVRDPSGFVKLRQAADTGSYGEWQACGFSYPIVTGDTIKATVFETGQSRSFVVPKLTIDTDRVSEVVSGKAPAGSHLTLEVSTSGASVVGLPDYDETRSLVGAGNGTYSYDFSTDYIDLIGGALATVTWQSAGGNVQVQRQTYVAGLSVTLGEAQFSGAFKPNAHLGIVVKHNGTQVATGDAVADPFYGGEISGHFVDSDTEPYAIQAGDRINAPGLGADGTFIVPDINGQANLATDHVSGTCFANGRWVVVVTDPDLFQFGFDFGTAGANGKFNSDLSGQLNIKKGFTVQIGCYTANVDSVVESFVTH
jgi:hypothetical protein